MPIIPDGVYTITKPHGHGATIIIASAPPALNSSVLVLPITPDKEFKWTVKNVSDGNVTIQNLASGSFLGYVGDPEQGTPCEQTHEAIEWRIQPTSESGKFHVVVPGGPVGGTELAFDASNLTVFPTTTALNALRLDDVDQAWSFVKQEE